MFGYICYNEFESDVIPDSGKTHRSPIMLPALFESDVIPDSGKTVIRSSKSGYLFESDVIPDSGKTFSIYSLI